MQNCTVNNRGAVLLESQIGLQKKTSSSKLLDPVLGLDSIGRFIQIGNDDVGAFLGKGVSHRTPDSTVSAGNYGYLVF
ncbi:hypothetical protein D3C71_2144730 [compost metagenome]